MTIEHFFTCPYCGENISFVVDTTLRRQTFVEDCEVCCRPIEARCLIEDNAVVEFDATFLER